MSAEPIEKKLIYVFTREWTKRELGKYCDSIVVENSEFANIILAGMTGILEPFLYISHHNEVVPEHLNEDVSDLKSDEKGTVESKLPRFLGKIGSIFLERRLFTAHLFYTRCHSAWYLFYFDQRDMTDRKQHWIRGPHIHLISHHFGRTNLADLWRNVVENDRVKAGKAFHLRYNPRRNSASDRMKFRADGDFSS